MTDLNIVTWWLSVSTSDTWGSKLYWRQVEMAHLPAEGDQVYVMATPDADDGAVEYEVLRRHWDVHGRVHLHFPQIVIDPEPPLDNHLPRGYTSWFTDQERCEPVQMLLDTGWREYTGREDGPDAG